MPHLVKNKVNRLSPEDQEETWGGLIERLDMAYCVIGNELMSWTLDRNSETVSTL